MGEPAEVVSVALERLTCGTCGISFAVPATWLAGRRSGEEEGGRFYCPNGHGRQFRETDVDRLKRQLKQAEAARDWHQRRAAERDRQLVAARGQMTKLKRRIQHGVCPECQRSFQNLRRHMATKHPQLTLPGA